MLALRLVVDTNVLVSAALKPDILQRTTLLLAITKPGRLYISTPVLEEYAEVLTRPELSIRKGLRLQLLQLIRNRGHLVTPSRHIEVTSDPDDNIFLECALAAKAHYLVTGNTDHFPKKRWKYTSVITPRMFINIWKDLRPEDEPPHNL